MRPELIQDKIMTHPITGKALTSKEMFAMLATAIGDIKTDDWFTQATGLFTPVTEVGNIIDHPEYTKNGFYDGIVSGSTVRNYVYNPLFVYTDPMTSWNAIGGAVSNAVAPSGFGIDLIVTGDGTSSDVGLWQTTGMGLTVGRDSI